MATTASSVGSQRPSVAGITIVRRLLLLLIICVVLVQLVSLVLMLSDGGASPHGDPTPPSSSAAVTHIEPGWVKALKLLREAETKFVIVEAKNGLGNRLRALASAMSVAAVLGRPLLLIWVSDLHCNCSFTRLFSMPLPFTLLEEEIPVANLTQLAHMQIYNYMRPEPGAVKDAPILPDPRSHIYFKSAFVMNHPYGRWNHAQQHLQRLTPAVIVAKQLIADKSMIGLHIRNVFDAPRDAATAKATTGAEAIAAAALEYGHKGASQLLAWRQASHWTNFVPRIESLTREHSLHQLDGMVNAPLRFYLAADSEEAYKGLLHRFPNQMVITRRECASERCDFRDCTGSIYALIDMLNLARTRLILGSGWSSYSEVAAYVGGQAGRPVPILMAGRDFGTIVGRQQRRRGTSPMCCGSLGEDLNGVPSGTSATSLSNNDVEPIQRHWPKPF
mmetsp:Transcript_28896/g.88598  ORF Transcript_28896/g.88598 Transcript_28896/m.88598 type:complete len:447 (+) Transcript_28896:151-1491(+)